MFKYFKLNFITKCKKQKKQIAIRGKSDGYLFLQL